MTYFELMIHRLGNHTQKAISYLELDDYEKALDALRDVIRDVRALSEVVFSTRA